MRKVNTERERDSLVHFNNFNNKKKSVKTQKLNIFFLLNCMNYNLAT